MKHVSALWLLTLAACGSDEQAAPMPAESEVAVASPAAGRDDTSFTQACAQFPQEVDDGTLTRPDVPRVLTAFVEATATTLTIRREAAPPACIDISYGEVDAWDSFADGRLLGIGISGHEYNSYLMVDRSGTGKPIETGRAPVFSPSKRRFASVDVSESAFGAFEALGVWEITDQSVRRLMDFPGIKLLISGGDWRLERWESDDCVIFSAANSAASSGQEDRDFFELVVTGPQDLRGPVAPEAACQPSA